MTARCLDVLGDDLIAIVLGGSLARGQGMVLGGAEGPRVLSDIDLYVVRAQAAPEREAALRELLRRDLENEGLVLAPLDLAFVEPDYFTTLGSALPARQLAIATRVLHESPGHAWARPDVLGRPDDPVDPIDAQRLLLNRMAESHLLEAHDGPEWFAHVHRAKRWIDAPLAWLAAQGMVHPSRDEQLRRMEELGASWSGAERAWLDRGLAVARDWLETIASRPLDPEVLRLWPGGGDDPLVAVRDWTWPFARALFRSVGRHGIDPAETLREEAARGRTGSAADASTIDHWLRRDPTWHRLRQARRWHPLAPVAIRPWWRYALGGAGHERVYAAAAMLYAGHDEWTRPLDSLVSDVTPLRRGGGLVIGRLWADWILGGGRR